MSIGGIAYVLVSAVIIIVFVLTFHLDPTIQKLNRRQDNK
jgi:F0F1-type ATP synthase membrane subunit b/b'